MTPEFFGYNRDMRLQYHGRLDDGGIKGTATGAGVRRRELFEALQQIAATGEGPREQVAATGCTIKWRAA